MNLKTLAPSEPKWLSENIILLGRVGSHAYGTATETSDLDYKGVCIPPIDYFLGLQSFEGFDKTGGKNFKNTSNDVDVTILHINKFVRDALAGVPNNLELLFLDASDYIHLDSFGKELISMRKHFLSKQIMKKFGGYAKSQSQKMQQLNSNGAARNDLVEKYGYDTKFYMHSVRLLKMAIEILSEGELTVKRKEADFLLALRNGYHSINDALGYIGTLEKALQESYVESLLPEQPDYEFIDNWLVNFNTRYIL